MVLLSAAVTTRTGKPLVARQFVEMTKARIENLLVAFPKLLTPTLQHTFVENESVRFLFLPMEALYLVLITTKQSNVVEDLDTLRLLGKIVNDACPMPSEEAIAEVAFDLVAAFDEVVSLGYRESITLQGVRANLEMNSHEEKLSIMIRQSKELEAKSEAKRQAANLKQKALAAAKSGAPTGFGPSSQSGFNPAPVSYQPQPAAPTPTAAAASAAKAGAAAAPKKGGLQLGKKKRGEDALEAMAAEDGLDADAIKDTNPAKLVGAAAPGAVAVPKEPVLVLISETVSASIKQDGSLASFTCNGEVQVTCRLDDIKCAVSFSRDDALAQGFVFKTHPQVDKALWDKSAALVLKQKDRAFTANAPFGALRYHNKPVDDVSSIPLSVTVWPQTAPGGKCNVNVEYELHGEFELLQVTVVVPLGSNEAPEVVNVEGGVTRHNSRRQQLEWVIDEVSPSAHPTGSLEFNLRGTDTTIFFPTTVSFNAAESLAGLQVSAVAAADTKEPIRFDTDVKLVTDAYLVGEE